MNKSSAQSENDRIKTNSQVEFMSPDSQSLLPEITSKAQHNSSEKLAWLFAVRLFFKASILVIARLSWTIQNYNPNLVTDILLKKLLIKSYCP